MVDNSKYWNYLRKEQERRLQKDNIMNLQLLERAGFTGKVKLNFGEIVVNFFEGGVTNMNKVFEPIMIVEESVKLK